MRIPDPQYTDAIGEAFRQFLSEHAYKKAIILCDTNTAVHCLPLLQAPDIPVIEIPAGESVKQMDTVMHVFDAMLQHACDKNTLLVNLGGGVVCDIGGFAASVYRRGIPFINIPTTLLAMADAAIGGKTGVDFRHLKNYIGSFAQAEAVLVSTVFLETLDADELQSARAEIIKTALVSDSGLYAMLLDGAGDMETLKMCALAKHRLVLKDPYDKQDRQLLNFGHTIGHAYESHRLASGNLIKHGYAVAMGMLCECGIACRLKLITEAERDSIKKLIKDTCGVADIDAAEFAQLGNYLLADKKNKEGELVFSLPEGIGNGRFGIRLSLNQVLDWKNQGII